MMRIVQAHRKACIGLGLTMESMTTVQGKYEVSKTVADQPGVAEGHAAQCEAEQKVSTQAVQGALNLESGKDDDRS